MTTITKSNNDSNNLTDLIRKQIAMEMYDPWIIDLEIRQHENWMTTIDTDDCAIIEKKNSIENKNMIENYHTKNRIQENKYIHSDISYVADHAFTIPSRWSLRSLRHDQNNAFVQSTLEKGVNYYVKSGDAVNAELCYKSVLDVNPDCSECLVRIYLYLCLYFFIHIYIHIWFYIFRLLMEHFVRMKFENRGMMKQYVCFVGHWRLIRSVRTPKLIWKELFQEEEISICR